MKFEEYLRSNKDKIHHNSPKKEMWEKIINARAKKTKIRKIPSWLKLASSFIIVICSAYLLLLPSKGTEDEVVNIPSKMKLQMAALANGEKTSQRILAVNMVDDVKVEDEDIIQILIERMQLDESKNVQLAAVRVLTKYIDNEDVRIAMLDELAAGNDPYIQMKVIEALSFYKENQGAQQWDALLESKTKENTLFENGTTEL